ncbi:MAG: gliding motility-associated C-terminal domain-containing protein, partial [Bacteroidota bacterium]
QTIWNDKHNVVANGSQVLSANSSDLVFVPVPGSTTLYYLFSIGSTSALQYQVIDMSKNAGEGEVISSITTTSQNNSTQFTIIRHQYADAFWVITHENGNTRFKAHYVDSSGVAAQTVLSDVGLTINTYGDMTGSNIGNKLAVTHFYGNGSIAEVFDFDRVCGIVSNANELHKETIWDYAYGVAFSPDDSKLYVTYGYMLSQLVQYYGTDYRNSYFIASSPQNFNIMRLAPDGRIYFTTHDNGIPGERINAILNPNEVGAGAVNYRETYLRLDEGTGKYRAAQFELPAFASGKKMKSPVEDGVFTFTGSCVNDPVKFVFNTTNPYDSLLWKFGDAANSQSKELNPVHQYKTGGRFGITLTIYRCGKGYELKDTIPVDSFPVFNFPGDTLVCAGTAIEFTGPVAQKYVWSTNETGKTIIRNNTGLVWLKASNGKCSTTDSVIVSNHPDVITLLGSEYFICEDEEELVKLDAGEGFVKYKWTPTEDTTQWIIVKKTGEYFVKVTDNFGCPGDDDARVKRRCGVLLYFPNIFTPNNDGLNDHYVPVGNDVTDFKMDIYNSWGELVFTSHHINNGWNGSFKNKPSGDGVYVYQAAYSGYKNKRLQTFYVKGNITLMR